MSAFTAIRTIMRGAPARLSLVLAIATGLAVSSAFVSSSSAHADSITFGFTFGNSAPIDRDYHEAIIDDDFGYEDAPVYRRDIPRYAYPAQRVRVLRRQTDTVCHVIPVRVLTEDGYVIEDVQRCREVLR